MAKRNLRSFVWRPCYLCCASPCHAAHAPSPGRPPFRARTREEAERFFVDSLDAWRQEQGLDKMVLMGEAKGKGRGDGVPLHKGRIVVASRC